jgi:hypothetical protein
MLPKGETNPVGIGYHNNDAIEQESLEPEYRGGTGFLETTPKTTPDLYLPIQING